MYASTAILLIYMLCIVVLACPSFTFSSIVSILPVLYFFGLHRVLSFHSYFANVIFFILCRFRVPDLNLSRFPFKIFLLYLSSLGHSFYLIYKIVDG